MKIILLFFLIISIKAQTEEYKFLCNITASEFNIKYSKEFKTKYSVKKCGCPHVPDGTIKFQHETHASEMNITYTTNGTTVDFIPTIIYEYADYNESQPSKWNPSQRTSETLALPKNKYKFRIVLSYEFRQYEHIDTASKLKSDNNTTGVQTNDQVTARYYSCESDVWKEVEIQSEFPHYSFDKSSAAPNQKCSGNFGTVSCNMRNEPANQKPSPSEEAKCVLQLEGTHHIEGKVGSQFSNVPVGKYRCQYVTPKCTFSGNELEVTAKKGCTPTQEWLDYQLYGEGQVYFYVGFIIGVIALLLNILMVIFSIKLCCSAEGSVERLAEEMAAEYREKHGIEMN